MNTYEPELGQMCFGHSWQQFSCPELMDAVLVAISNEYERIWWNVWQEECDSPFYNNGPYANFKCPVFEVYAYDWNNDEQPFNFAWRDLRISWYKHSQRGGSSNQEITPDIANQCLTECLGELRRLEGDFPVDYEGGCDEFKACCVGRSPPVEIPHEGKGTDT